MSVLIRLEIGKDWTGLTAGVPKAPRYKFPAMKLLRTTVQGAETVADAVSVCKSLSNSMEAEVVILILTADKDSKQKFLQAADFPCCFFFF